MFYFHIDFTNIPPLTPKQTSCVPPKKQIIQAILAHPATALPEICSATAHIAPIKLITETQIPIVVIILRGLTLKLVIPSKASSNILFNG